MIVRRINQKTVVRALLKWFAENARDLPWRRIGDPYAIWVSEIMLQQTQVKTVVPYWERWMRDLPDITALAKARSEKIHKLWEGLGYYTRVRNMQSAARLICETHGGEFPRNFEDVLALPGIGPYTAGAICSIAFNQPTPILDGNVIRVLTRLFGIDGNPREKETNKKLWRMATELVEESRFGVQASARCSKNTNSSNKLKLELQTCSQLNQSLMELGALICTPKEPVCGICPVAEHCVALRENRVQELPSLSKRASVTQRRFVAFVAQECGRVLVQQRPAGVVNGHLWEFPNVEIGRKNGDLQAAAREALGFNALALEPLLTIKHSITRYRMTLEVFRAGMEGALSNGVWRDDGSRGKPLKRLKELRRSTVTRLKLGVNERKSKEVPTPFFISLRQGVTGNGGGRWMRRGELARLAFCSAHKKILARL